VRSGPSRTGEASSDHHIPSLDGLRGIAILLVLAYHFASFGTNALTNPVAYALTYFGWIGVDLFFVLSGFLITGILLDMRNVESRWRTFYARRVLRILPLYYLFLAGYWGWRHFAPLHAEYASQAWYWLHGSNLVWSFDIAGEVPLELQHFWSLAVEEQFYLVWPSVVWACSRRSLTGVCVACVVVAPLLRAALWLAGHPLAPYAFMPARVDVLAMGALLALAARAPGGLPRWRTVASYAFWTSTTAVVSLIAYRRGYAIDDDLVQVAGLSLNAVLFGATLALALTSSAKARLTWYLTAWPLRRLGKYSYGLYVLHQPLIVLLLKNGFAAQDLVARGYAPALAFAIVLVVAIPLTLAATLLSWRAVERPFLRLKRFVPYRTIAPWQFDVNPNRVHEQQIWK
jgi:peptidoglycan/LPS O-acetylase OafA/YrhL